MTVTFPYQRVIPGTDYLLEVLDLNEFRMGMTYYQVRILSATQSVHVDLSSWRCVPTRQTEGLIDQSEENSKIVFFQVLVTELTRRQEVQGQHLYPLKVNLPERTYRIAERGEDSRSVDEEFFPVEGMQAMRQFLETHIRGKKARKQQSRFHR